MTNKSAHFTFVMLFFSLQPYATTFPLVSVDDMVHAFFLTLDSLGIGKVCVTVKLIFFGVFFNHFFLKRCSQFYWLPQVHAVVGASLGGMSSLNAAALYRDRVGR